MITISEKRKSCRDTFEHKLENVKSNLPSLSCEETFPNSKNLRVHMSVYHEGIGRGGESQSGEVYEV